MRILVIDDSEIARAQMVSLLTDADFVVFEQPSAIGATRTIIQNTIEAAVVDISMPGLSGDKLVGLLRSNPRLAGLIVIVVSARPLDELERIASEVDADAAVEKARVAVDLIPTLRRLGAWRGLSRNDPTSERTRGASRSAS